MNQQETVQPLNLSSSAPKHCHDRTASPAFQIPGSHIHVHPLLTLLSLTIPFCFLFSQHTHITTTLFLF
ncbi:hypothetical protein RJT34_11503 [Clitoria ternatea]|uniref:Uncharacterized protein n=1 Tax=Clitoria ternatea TaxID=43366 RepID=A0AAN9JK24_CLITE